MKDDNFKCFTKTDNGLLELVLDLDTWNLVNYVVRPKVLEIWVILGVVGEDETVHEANEIANDSY